MKFKLFLNIRLMVVVRSFLTTRRLNRLKIKLNL